MTGISSVIWKVRYSTERGVEVRGSQVSRGTKGLGVRNGRFSVVRTHGYVWKDEVSKLLRYTWPCQTTHKKRSEQKGGEVERGRRGSRQLLMVIIYTTITLTKLYKGCLDIHGQV